MSNELISIENTILSDKDLHKVVSTEKCLKCFKKLKQSTSKGFVYCTGKQDE